jgi:hypothetical protein
MEVMVRAAAEEAGREAAAEMEAAMGAEARARAGRTLDSQFLDKRCGTCFHSSPSTRLPASRHGTRVQSDLEQGRRELKAGQACQYRLHRSRRTWQGRAHELGVP